MTLVDTQGRLFGRWNVVDAMVGVVLLLLIPVLLGGYLLFRPSEPALNAVEPARIQEGASVDLTIRGVNLRPYMRVYLNDRQGSAFLFADHTKAVVPITQIPVGTYDVVLYDQTHERARLRNAFEVVANARAETQLDVVGSFTAVATASLPLLKEGLTIPGFGQVLHLGKPGPSITRTAVAAGVLMEVPSTQAFNVDAVVRADCTLSHRGNGVSCTALGQAMTEDTVVQPVVSGVSMLFQIDQIRTAGESGLVTVRARFGGDRAVLDRMRPGDRDQRRGNEFAAAGTIVSADATRGVSASLAMAAPIEAGRLEPFVLADLGVRELVLRLPAQQTAGGWDYAGRTLSAGRLLTFHGPDYEVTGTIVSMTPQAGGQR